MSVVLDSCAIIAIGLEDRDAPNITKIVYENICYMSPAGVAEAYFLIRKYASVARADHLMDWILSRTDVRVEDDNDPEIITTAGEIMMLGGISAAACFTAALGKKMKLPVVTNDPCFDIIEHAGFCEVKRLVR
jgi:uncharacterized protein with PIN domain